jgi:dynein heavy chain
MQGVILGARDRFNRNATAAFGGNVSTPEGYLLALWLHECRRVFADKLVNYEDKGWLDKTLAELMRENFQVDLIRQVCG